MTFKLTLGSKGLGNVADARPLRQSWSLRQRTIYTEKVCDIDHGGIYLRISSIFLIFSFNKAGKFLSFKRKTTLLNKAYISFQYSNRDFAHHKVAEWVMMIKI